MMTQGAEVYNMAAYNKIKPLMYNFLQQYWTVMSAKSAVFGYLDKLKMIQRQWRALISHDEIRQIRLRKLWDNRLEDLIKRNNNAKTKRAQTLVRKLRSFGPEIRNKSISEYYTNIKNQYIKALRMYIRGVPKKPKSPVFIIIFPNRKNSVEKAI